MNIVGFAAANLRNNLWKAISIKTGVPLSLPRKVEICPSLRCNARCVMCEYWHTREAGLSTEEALGTLRELRQWIGPSFFVHVAGGEPLIYPGIFDLFSYCASQGIVCGANTNGIALDDVVCRRLTESGVSYINVSLDSHQPEVHDRFRGRDGVFEKAVGGLARLRAAGGSILLGVSTIVMRDNVSCLREMTEFLLSLDIDRVMFQPIRPAGSLPVAQWPDCEGWVDDLDALGRGFAYLSERRKTDPRIQVSAKALRDMQRYFADPATPDRARSCGLGYERLVILSNGDIQMCYGEFPPIGNIRNGNIAQVWRSAAAKRCRAAMRGCVAPCPNHIKRELSLADKARKFVFFAKTGLLH